MRVDMDHASMLQAILAADPLRRHALDVVLRAGPPDGWIGAGFIRNAVWDHLHGRPPGRHIGDVDVVWFDPERTDRTEDPGLQAALRSLDPTLDWSVKNQARMHLRNGDAPYGSVVEAMRCWPETATAVAVRQTRTGRCEIAAPFSLDDLFAMVLKPRFAGEKGPIFQDRVGAKRWLVIWPKLRMTDPG